jgi:hypothetical protein
MAGDWMKVELDLPDKPEVEYIANALQLEPAAVVGHLIKVWAWFNKHTENGNAYGVTYSLLDRLTGVANFGEVMMLAGWMEQKDKTLSMPKFDRHTSESAKKRALSSSRTSRFRNATVNASVTQSALPREEKRRSTTTSLSGGSKEPLPKDWFPKENTVDDVSREFGLRVPEDVNRYVAAFRDTCEANGYRYKDFDAAFRNCVRQDWPKLRNGNAAIVGPKKVAV